MKEGSCSKNVSLYEAVGLRLWQLKLYIPLRVSTASPIFNSLRWRAGKERQARWGKKKNVGNGFGSNGKGHVLRYGRFFGITLWDFNGVMARSQGLG